MWILKNSLIHFLVFFSFNFYSAGTFFLFPKEKEKEKERRSNDGILLTAVCPELASFSSLMTGQTMSTRTRRSFSLFPFLMFANMQTKGKNKKIFSACSCGQYSLITFIFPIGMRNVFLFLFKRRST